MNLNQIDTKNPSWIQKEIVIKNTKCELSYMEALLGNAPSELMAVFEEDFYVARIKITDDICFKIFCEEHFCGKDDYIYMFDVYSYIDDGEVRARSEYINEVLCAAIDNENELISLMEDLMDYTYFN